MIVGPGQKWTPDYFCLSKVVPSGQVLVAKSSPPLPKLFLERITFGRLLASLFHCSWCECELNYIKVRATLANVSYSTGLPKIVMIYGLSLIQCDEYFCLIRVFLLHTVLQVHAFLEEGPATHFFNPLFLHFPPHNTNGVLSCTLSFY